MDAQQYYSIAERLVCLETPRPLRQTERFFPFVAPPGAATRTVRFQEVAKLALPQGLELFRSIFFSVYQTEKGLIRVYRDHKDGDRPYAVRRVWELGSLVEVAFQPEDWSFFCESGNAFYHVALEEWMLRCGGVILHASLVDVEGQGLIFSGPAGVGKSTQAELWQREAGGRVLNGDRVILRRSGGAWRGYGSPYAGSSRYWRNESVPIRALVFLAQGTENRVVPLSALDAFRSIWPNLTLNTWNPVFVDWASRITASLVGRLPVFRLTCTPDSRAVDALRAVLAEGGMQIGSK